jgi:tyrosine-protein kinase
LSLRDYLQILWRCRWLVIAVIVAVPAGAVVYSLQQAPAYRADAEVLLSHQDVAAALSGTPDTRLSQDADRDARTQSQLARVPAVATAAIEAAGVPMSLGAFFKDSSVTSSPNSDLLEFRVEHRTRTGAERLVNAYARAFVRYREALDTTSLRRAQREVAGRLHRLAASGDRRTALYRNLAAKHEELRVLRTLQTSRAAVVQSADSAAKVRPKPVRNGILGFVLALILGGILAFLWDALSARVRSAPEIAEHLQLPLLARLPKPARRLRKQNQLVMLAEPHDAAAEAFRVLRTNLDLVNVDRGARTIMVVSAVEGEGKSTTIANLAVAAARAGRHVVLVDLDLRRGDIDQLFGVANWPGITDVAYGKLGLTDALVPIDVNPGWHAQPITIPAIAVREPTGSLQILPAGQLPSEAGDFVVSDTTAEILAELRQAADLIVIDAPPLLQAGDAMAISARVDGVVIVAQLDVRRSTLDELSRTLEQSTADKLGLIVTGDKLDQSHYGGYYGSMSANSDLRQPIG